jgi:hypothetical protein
MLIAGHSKIIPHVLEILRVSGNPGEIVTRKVVGGMETM